MGKSTNISWCDHTFNPWWGCSKVSPACANCYAETIANRFTPGIWGKDAPRRFFGDKHWNEPLAWDRSAEKAGVKRRVFCGSMCDVFEDREDLEPQRKRLIDLIRRTPNLTWLLLTKRLYMFPTYYGLYPILPRNMWLGITAENQEWFDKRTPSLSVAPVSKRFISCEPLLGPIDISKFASRIDWVIVGGESGPNARPMNPEWVRSLRDQCYSMEIPFHFKSWGSFYNVRKRRSGDLLDGKQHKEFPI